MSPPRIALQAIPPYPNAAPPLSIGTVTTAPAGTQAAAAIRSDAGGNQLLDLILPPNTNQGAYAGLSTGLPNAHAVTVPSYAGQPGQSITFLVGAGLTNTDALTVNPNGLGPKPVRKPSNNGPVACTGGEVVAGNIYTLYDGGQGFLQLLPAGQGTIELDPREFGAVANADATAALLATIAEAHSLITGQTIVINLGGCTYLVSAPLAITGVGNDCNIIVSNGQLVASLTFPIGQPVLWFSSNAYKAAHTDLVIDCAYRADGVLSEGGGGGAYHVIHQNALVLRQKNYGIELGCLKQAINEPAVPFAFGERLTYQGSGCSGIFIRYNLNNATGLLELFVADPSRNPTTKLTPINGEVITGARGGTVTVGSTWRPTSSQNTVVNCRVLARQPGDTDYAADNDVGVDLIVAAVDCKVFHNIFSRAYDCTVRVAGWQNLFANNHTFPVGAWSNRSTNYPAIPKRQWTNYEVWYGGNQWNGNYVDNGSIDLWGGAAAASGINANLYTKLDTDISLNAAGVRLIAIGANDRVQSSSAAGGTAQFGPFQYGGGGASDLTAYAYVESAGNTWADKVIAASPAFQANADVEFQRDTKVRVSGANATVHTHLAGTQPSIKGVEFSSGTHTTAGFPGIGSYGDNLTFWGYGGVVRGQHTSYGWDLTGSPLYYSEPWVTAAAIPDITNDVSGKGYKLNAVGVFNLPATLPTRTWGRVAHNAAGNITFTPAAGAKVNGVAGATKVSANVGDLITWRVVDNADGNSAEYFVNVTPA